LCACEAEGLVVAWDGVKFTKVVFAERCSQVIVDTFQNLTDGHPLSSQCYRPPSFEPERKDLVVTFYPDLLDRWLYSVGVEVGFFPELEELRIVDAGCVRGLDYVPLKFGWRGRISYVIAKMSMDGDNRTLVWTLDYGRMQ
jgi:hypothetical protein